MQDFEKLGVFYLGRKFDQQSGETSPELVLYDSKDLTTHAVCVGMTGSGKTGLCLALLEEAAIDGVPAIVIDPKGDLGNLLLTFPDLRGSDFQPWVNADDAHKAGVSADEFAAGQAELWKNGLGQWGQDGERIRRLRQAADFSIYTPGSLSGLPLSVLSSFAAPPPAVRDDAETLGDRIAGTVASLLGLVGVDADPIKSREHILLSAILEKVWKEGRDIGLGDLVQLVQTPPIERLGVMELETVFPSKQRFELAMLLNNLLASPGFETWLQGDPLDVGSLLHTASGKPRMSIISIAHLSDAERMFVVSLLLNQIVSWTRSQPGTTSLRAIIYMDEIFGYFPPVANPPSKQPLLTLLKQARAYGVGVVLATQNPVDLDYKGLSNAGTWFIGRLQTERDKARVLEGLEGAAASAAAKFDRAAMEQTLAGLGQRVFLLNNVHEDGPVVFQTRWVMSYLRGPLTRDQIKALTAAERAARDDTPVEPELDLSQLAPVKATASPASNASSSPSSPSSSSRPVLPPDVPERFLPVRRPPPEGAVLSYQPLLFGAATIHFSDTRLGVEHAEPGCWLAELPESGDANWPEAEAVDLDLDSLENEPHNNQDAAFASPASSASKAKSYTTWRRELVDHLYRSGKLELFHCNPLKQYSHPGETERDFRIRLQQAAREARDAEADKLRAAYGKKYATLKERIRKAEQAVEREQAQSSSAWMSTAVSAGSTLLGALLGRKTLSATNLGKAATTARGVGRSRKQAGDVARAKENVESLQQQLRDMEAKFEQQLDALQDKIDPTTIELSTKTLKPKKSNIVAQLVALAWAPTWSAESGDAVAAWK
ncbi:MAG: DUF87 domain-containing protein [Pirellulaceae bacterium]